MFAIAEEPLLGALREAGVRTTEDPDEIDLVIASFDRTLEYRKLQIAFDALWRRGLARLLATNPDPGRCVMTGDRLYTDVAAADAVGMSGALVLSGETDLDAVEGLDVGERPDYVLARIDHLLPASAWGPPRLGGGGVSAVRFALGPTDLPGLLGTVREWPGAEDYPPLEPRRVEVGSDAFPRLIDRLRPGVPVVALGSGTVTNLAKMNVLGGLSATLADESAPLSGYEHVTGHMLDMGSEHFDRALADHGAQVAVALIPHAIAFDALVRELDPERIDVERCYPSAERMEGVVRETFSEIGPSGRMAEECWSDYSTKLEAWHGARERFEAMLADWPRERERLLDLLTPPDSVVRILAAAGAPLRFPDLEPPVSEEEGRWAFEHAHLMRKRFSAGDLYYLLGWLDAGFSDRVFARRDELVGGAGG